MRKILFILFLTAFSVPISAQTVAKVKVQANGLGRVLVTKGKTRSVVDLSKDIAGCVYVSRVAKRELDKKGCAASPADIKLIDATEKNERTFLLLTANAQENCNVCGRCGASAATTIIWLQLDARLRLLEKKNIPLEYCQYNVSMISPISDFNEETQEETLKIPFKDNVLTIEFEKRIYGEGVEDGKDVFEFTRIEYDRTKPEKGFIIVTEKRDKSSMREN